MSILSELAKNLTRRRASSYLTCPGWWGWGWGCVGVGVGVAVAVAVGMEVGVRCRRRPIPTVKGTIRLKGKEVANRSLCQGHGQGQESGLRLR